MDRPVKRRVPGKNQNRCRKTDAADQHDRDHAGPGCIFFILRAQILGQNHSNRRRCHAQHDNHQVHDLVRIDNRCHRGLRYPAYHHLINVSDQKLQ